ncbi:MAG: sigma-70 family RNA polymerase sigma factor [Oscillospiraceae bacterium]|nr:sigma-70 family RNA polymerase sigma factor [Oscillospiraceae bacterium]
MVIIMDDIKIIELYENRDQQAVVESQIKYGKLLYSISYGVLSNRMDSEECVNDTYLNTWNSIPPQKPQNLMAYLGRIVRNLSIDKWHKERSKKRGGGYLLTELSDCIPSGSSVEGAIENNKLSEVIEKWLNSLPQDERVLFMRRYWFGESLDSLAKETETPANNLAVRIFRLRKKLKLTLEKEGISL